MPDRRFTLSFCAALACWGLGLSFAGAGAAPPSSLPSSAPATRVVPTVRVAALAVLNDFDFWTALAARFERETGVHVETVVSGNKDAVADRFRAGGIDLITMYGPEAMIGLAASGDAVEMTPWVSTDLVLVGPAEDPAKVKGMSEVSKAVAQILAAKAPLLVHASLGADEVVRAVLLTNKGQIDPANPIVSLDDHQKHVLQDAMSRQAYTLISRTAYLTGKLPTDGYAILVEGDARLSRPILMAVANPAKLAGVHSVEARQLQQFLLQRETQAWIEAFGTEKSAGRPLFHGLGGGTGARTMAGGDGVRITGDVEHAMGLSRAEIAAMPHVEIKFTPHHGTAGTYSGVPLREVLLRAGVPIDKDRMRGVNLARYAVVLAADGYRVVFALPEFDAEFRDRPIVLADTRDGVALDGKEGPYRLIVADEAMQARDVRGVVEIRLGRAE